MVRIALGAALLALLSPHALTAQDSASPRVFETAPWGVLVNNQWSTGVRDGIEKNRLRYRFGDYLHIGLNQAYRQHLLDHVYQTGDGGPVVFRCKDAEGEVIRIPRSRVDTLLRVTRDAAGWHTDIGFPSVGDKFNMVPEINVVTTVDADGNEKTELKFNLKQFVNLIVCDADSSIASVSYNETKSSVNLLAIENDFLENTDTLPGLVSTMGHEVAHIHQNQLMPVANDELSDGPAALALTEGFAEATANVFAFALLGGHHRTIARDDVTYTNSEAERMFMVRAYNVPLLLNEAGNEDLGLTVISSNAEGRDLLSSVDNWMLGTFSYESSGFYFHLIERYMDGNPSGIIDLYKRIDFAASQNLYPVLDSFWDTIDGTRSKGLEHGLPQFHAEYAGWWEEPRTRDKDLGSQRWLNATFGGCAEVELSSENITNFVDLNIAKFAGSCVEVILSGDIVTRLPELEMILSSEDGNSREVYAGLVKVIGVDGDPFTCFKFVEERGARGAPCLLDPIDGYLTNAWPSIVDPITRNFYIGSMHNSSGNPIRIRLIFTHVPEDLTGQDSINADAEKYRLTLALDSMLVEGDGIQPASAEATEHGAAAFTGEGPRQPFASGRPGTLSDSQSMAGTSMYQDMLAGNLSIPGLPVLQATGAGPAMLFGFEAKSAFGEFSIFLQPQHIPTYGEVGRYDLAPMGGGYFAGDGEELALFDPDRPSYVDIFENTPEVLSYFGEVHVCTFNTAELMAEIMADRDRHYCEFGRQRTYILDTTVAFPELVPGAGRLGSATPLAPLPPTPAYEKYKNLRLAQLGMELGNHPDPASDIVTNAAANTRSDSSINQSDDTTRSLGETVPANGCDCTCGGKSQLDQLLQLGQATREQNACKLLCGRQWNSCGE
jgi:hypothetical protein